jgi:hypothetical protein
MRPVLAVSAGVSLMLLASVGWAGGKRSASSPGESAKDKEAAPASFNKTFQWEEKELGPKDKGVNHDRIAAMQEQGRREDAARKREPAKKPARTEGVNGPASSVIPTQDIEKPAAVRAPVRKASYTPPRQHDAIDNVLAENGVGSGSDEGTDGLNKVFGHSSSPKHKVARRAKHGRRRR